MLHGHTVQTWNGRGFSASQQASRSMDLGLRPAIQRPVVKDGDGAHGHSMYQGGGRCSGCRTVGEAPPAARSTRAGRYARVRTVKEVCGERRYRPR